MKLKISIEYSNPTLPMSNVAQILNSFALIHEGMNFMLNGNVDELQGALSNLSKRSDWPILVGGFFPPYPFYDWTSVIRELPDSLYVTGERMFEPGGNDDFLGKLPTTFLDVPVQTLLTSFSPETAPEVASVKKGSLEAEIEKIIERLRKIFGAVISSPSILSGAKRTNNGRTLQALLGELGTESSNQSSRYVGAGITTIGAGMLAVCYRELSVTSVKISSDDDEEQVFANEDVSTY